MSYAIMLVTAEHNSQEPLKKKSFSVIADAVLDSLETFRCLAIALSSMIPLLKRINTRVYKSWRAYGGA